MLPWLQFLILLQKGGIWRLLWFQLRLRERTAKKANSEVRVHYLWDIVEVSMIMNSKSWKQWDPEVVISVEVQPVPTVEIRIRDQWQKSEREKASKSSFRIWGTWSFIQKPSLFYIIHSKSAGCHQQQDLALSACFKCPIITTRAHVRTSFCNSLHQSPWVHKISEQRWPMIFDDSVLYQCIMKKQD